MLKLFVCYNLGMIINIDDLDFNDPDERRVILEHRKKKREENLALKKSVNNGYLKGQRGVRLYYDYDKIDFDNCRIPDDHKDVCGTNEDVKRTSPSWSASAFCFSKPTGASDGCTAPRTGSGFVPDLLRW